RTTYWSLLLGRFLAGGNRLGRLHGSDKPLQTVLDLGPGPAFAHFRRHRNRLLESDLVSAAMAFDDDPIEPQHHPAVYLARVQRRAKLLQRGPGQKIAGHRKRAGPEGVLQHARDHPGETLGRLQRDVAGKAIGHHDIDRALADVVALDKAME